MKWSSDQSRSPQLKLHDDHGYDWFCSGKEYERNKVINFINFLILILDILSSRNYLLRRKWIQEYWNKWNKSWRWKSFDLFTIVTYSTLCFRCIIFAFQVLIQGKKFQDFSAERLTYDFESYPGKKHFKTEIPGSD